MRPKSQEAKEILAKNGFSLVDCKKRGVDILACKIGCPTIMVQCRTRLSLYKKNVAKEVYMCFPAKEEWYLIPHSNLVETVAERANYLCTKSWQENDEYKIESPSEHLLKGLSKWKLSPSE